MAHDANVKANIAVNEVLLYKNSLKCQIRWQYQPWLMHIFIQKYLNLYISEKDLKIAEIKKNFILFASFSACEH